MTNVYILIKKDDKSNNILVSYLNEDKSQFLETTIHSNHKEAETEMFNVRKTYEMRFNFICHDFVGIT